MHLKARALPIAVNLLLTVSFCAILAMANRALADDSSFGYAHKAKFGDDDRVGAANYLSQKNVLAASRLISEGKTYALGMVSSKSVPVFGNRKYDIEVIGLDAQDETGLSAHDDRVISHLGVGTQIDGLGHVGIGKYFYNRLERGDFFDPTGLTQLGSEGIPPIVGRGVLLDVAGFQGVDRLAASEVIDVKTLRRVAKAQKITLKKGDVVLIHTGWMSMMNEDAKAYIAYQPGINLAAAEYLAKKGVVAIGSDTGGLEVHPSELGKNAHLAPVHGLLLANYGVYILENIVTKELANDMAYEFMFVLGQPRLKGTVQAIINPIAIR